MELVFLKQLTNLIDAVDLNHCPEPLEEVQAGEEPLGTGIMDDDLKRLWVVRVETNEKLLEEAKPLMIDGMQEICLTLDNIVQQKDRDYLEQLERNVRTKVNRMTVLKLQASIIEKIFLGVMLTKFAGEFEQTEGVYFRKGWKVVRKTKHLPIEHF